MPKRMTEAAEGEFYHVFNRGALRTSLFYSTPMYHLFITMMHHFAESCGITLVAVCLMPNHFHMLIRVGKDGKVDRFMRLLCGGYSRRVNGILRRTGTIYEGRFHIKHVSTDNYFRCLCKYIHLNPVKAALADHPTKWNYSNYLECTGSRKLFHTDHQFITKMFGSVRRYEAFVMENIHSTKIEDENLAKDLADMRLV